MNRLKLPALVASIVFACFSFQAGAQTFTQEQKEAIGVASAQANQRAALNWALNPTPGTLPPVATVQMPQIQVTQTPLGKITTYPAGTIHPSAVTCVTPETALQMCRINGQWLPMPNLGRNEQPAPGEAPATAQKPATDAKADSQPKPAVESPPPPTSPGGPIKGQPRAGDCQVTPKGVVECEALPPAYGR